MATIKSKPYTAARRQYSVSDFADLSKVEPYKPLLVGLKRQSGINNQGRKTNINSGGGHKRRYRLIDFRRENVDVVGIVESVEYDPNRSARIALVVFSDGQRRYILAPKGLTVGGRVVSGSNVEVAPGNTMPLGDIPVGQIVHNIELKVGAGGRIVRSAGCGAQILAREGQYTTLRLPSGEVRKVFRGCRATIGQVGNDSHNNISIGKAGRSRWLGIRPHNRGVTKNPVDHPMGGGEGRTSGGRHPCSPTAVPSKGYRTRKNKRTERFIVRSRKVAKRRK